MIEQQNLLFKEMVEELKTGRDKHGRDVFWVPKKETNEHQINHMWNEHQKRGQMSTK
jgi:hypothetical protein